jgi:hypothetical protein
VRANQLAIFDDGQYKSDVRIYRPVLTVSENGKGVLDVDTVKGCTMGLAAYPNGGCYGECYAYKTATRNGIDYSVSVSRKLFRSTECSVFDQVKNHKSTWYRVGVSGDPCHDWENTVDVCEKLKATGKTPVIITKHWIPLTDEQITRLRQVAAVVNTSTSGLDSEAEINYRVDQLKRLKSYGIKSVCRVVTCSYGQSEWARARQDRQNYLLSMVPVIDNPLRVRKSNKHVLNGDIIAKNNIDSIGGGKVITLHRTGIYIGKCNKCPDQCGVQNKPERSNTEMKDKSMPLFSQNVEFKYVESVIGSGYEKDVAKLAIEDGIAYRAARKNMQIHSAIILLINSEFAGFMTFQNNHECREFCLLQSVIKPELHTDELYKAMVLRVIEQNTSAYPAIMTTNPKSKFETPKLFKSMGFKTYLSMSGFEYMVYGEEKDIRHKLLAHITMTNVWNSLKGDWLKLKNEWNDKIELAGEKYNIPNPKFATREGCWQGDSGFSNVVLSERVIEGDEIIHKKGRSHNGNASVLDPVACEVILRFFMPREGKMIYNPFGGGVQFGFIAGEYGYEYMASEIRQNQCDANNKLCSDFDNVKWIKSDSATYEPEGNYDLIFTCPPYYKVEKYIDYDGNPPTGEINSLSTYNQFRDTLFEGYKIAINHLNYNCFFVVMTGDSRDKNGAYYCSESETELFLKDQGLAIYNKIVYLESEFTRLAQAKKTLNYRKFPKREQKIIVAYKGDISEIKNLYAPVGRL